MLDRLPQRDRKTGGAQERARVERRKTRGKAKALETEIRKLCICMLNMSMYSWVSREMPTGSLSPSPCPRY